jgi:two-component sensor histidine kinase
MSAAERGAQQVEDTLQMDQREIAVLPPLTVGVEEEVGHRFFNSLQLISAFLSAQGRITPDPAARKALESSVHRIAAVAAIQRHLYNQAEEGLVDVSTYLLDLACMLRASVGGQHRQVHVQAQPVLVPTGFATNLGILASELVINACKHAYRDGEIGDVDLSFKVRLGSLFKLEVRDYGLRAGLAQLTRPGGLGNRIVETMSRKLGGTATYTARDDGLRVLVQGVLPKEANRQHPR